MTDQLLRVTKVALLTVAMGVMLWGHPGGFCVAGMFSSVLLLYVKRESLSETALYGALIGVAICAFSLTSQLRPRTLDGMLWRSDEWLGLPGARLWACLEAHAALRWIVALLYALLPMVLVWVSDRTFMFKVYFATTLAFIVYLIFPACGPTFYLHSENLSELPRNCIPAMHLGYALLMRRQVSGRSLPWRAAMDGVVIGMILATIGLMEHYVVDLVATIPFIAGVEWLWSKLLLTGWVSSIERYVGREQVDHQAWSITDSGNNPGSSPYGV
jgi:PAP2 superfamily protein